MLSAITAALNGLKEATGLLQTVQQFKNEAQIEQKTQELRATITSIQQNLIDIQISHTAALQRINELETQLMQTSQWETEKQRYHLHQLASGSFVYRVKESMQNGEPIHDICPQCYEVGIKSILQFAGFEGAYHKHICSKCQTIVLGERLKVPMITGGRRNRSTDGY